MNKIVMFDTTHHALWAEEVARNKGFDVEIVPAPESSDAKCGMAMEIVSGYEEVLAALRDEGIPFKEM
jgi:hypothetical protein